MNSTERKLSLNETGEKQLEKLTDSAESATNKFRDRFEDFLHQETLQQQAPTSPDPSAKPTTGRKMTFLKK